MMDYTKYTINFYFYFYFYFYSLLLLKNVAI